MTTNTPHLHLRDITDADLPIFQEFEKDTAAAHMAGFPTRWDKLLDNPTVHLKTIIVDEQVVGNVVAFPMNDGLGVAYWIGTPFWGRGIASRALAAFLAEMTTRPLYARAAKDNVRSLRVLEKCGFVITGEGKVFSPVRNEEIEDWILTQRDGGDGETQRTT